MIHFLNNILGSNHQEINYVVGNGELLNKPTIPYSDTVCEFLEELSTALMKHSEAREYPDVIAFAFWCRKANLAILKKKFLQNNPIRLGRGIVFHIAPANVPVNFAFSLCFGLIAGNTNIVRISSKNSPQVELICSILNELLQSTFVKLIDKIAVIRYEHSNNLTAKLSSICNARIIWGGDKTIQNIRKFQTSPRCVDISFSDRYSISILNSQAIDNITPQELSKMASDFYNDTYTMDQNACSSPHVILWLGENSQRGKSKFWNALFKVALKKYDLTEIKAIDKYSKVLDESITSDKMAKFVNMDNVLMYIELKNISQELHNYRGIFGLFYTCEIENLNQLITIINNKYQTVTYYGIDKKELTNFVIENGIIGIDRVVPVGRALDMDTIWDGYDVIGYLSRVIDIH